VNKKLQVAKYLFFDFIAAADSWGLFYFYRKVYIEPEKFGGPVPIELSSKFYVSLILIPLCWILIYYLAGTYKNIFRKSRLKELWQTFVISLVGVLIIFFVLILDDEVISYKTYYRSFFALFGFHFILTATFRIILSSITNNKIFNRVIGFNTLLIGSNENAHKLFTELESQQKSAGNKFQGFVHIDNRNGFSDQLKDKLPHLGEFGDIRRLIKEHKIEEVIIAIESSEHENIGRIINEIEEGDVIIKIIPDMYDILAGTVRMNSIFGAPLIEVSRELLPAWQQSVKRMFDVVVSMLALIIGSPVYLFIGLCVKFGSKGPIFYSHERIGWHGKPFFIHKFRSMYTDAEKNGPALSSKDDARITPFGKVLRKIRLDELPQFYNVLIGDMSIVGPRPERQFYIDQITKKAPHYKHLHKVRPGITSWGQVKYGYAENVDQMVERLKYDLIYIEDMSLYVDFKILIYTIIIVFQGRGK